MTCSLTISPRFVLSTPSSIKRIVKNLWFRSLKNISKKHACSMLGGFCFQFVIIWEIKIHILGDGTVKSNIFNENHEIYSWFLYIFKNNFMTRVIIEGRCGKWKISIDIYVLDYHWHISISILFFRQAKSYPLVFSPCGILKKCK